MYVLDLRFGIYQTRNFYNLFFLFIFQTRILQEPLVVQLDISELKSIPNKVKDILHRVGGSVDILINNAGQSYRGEVVNTYMDVDLKLMLVNYFGHVAITKGNTALRILYNVKNIFQYLYNVQYPDSKHVSCLVDIIFS